MKKYPDIDFNEITTCIKKIRKPVFNTYDFIDIWITLFPYTYNNFSSIGVGWRKMVGRNLSKNSGRFSTYIKLNRKNNGAQLWQKI